ncbi:MAG: hypothetical protein OJJ54_04225 [Pseudonocardia sp.]|nr:hypothetical protein [Pseudonocardia sp.]
MIDEPVLDGAAAVVESEFLRQMARALRVRNAVGRASVDEREMSSAERLRLLDRTSAALANTPSAVAPEVLSQALRIAAEIYRAILEDR